MERLEIMRWLEDKGFEEIPEGWIGHVLYQKKDQVRVLFKDKVVRVEEKRSMASRLKANWANEWIRIGGTYYKHIKIDETGMLRGMGFMSVISLKDYINMK